MVRVAIRSTPANDLHLMMNLLAPSSEIAKLMADPVAFARSYRGEWRYLQQVARAYADRQKERAPESVPLAGTDATTLKSSDSTGSSRGAISAEPSSLPADQPESRRPSGQRTSLLR
jgi:hypothetical protein